MGERVASRESGPSFRAGRRYEEMGVAPGGGEAVNKSWRDDCMMLLLLGFLPRGILRLA